MNLKAFFVAALSTALELGIAAADDVLRHVTPDVLSIHLPRPLWARLFTACLGAGKVDAQLVVDTVGVPNLCEHVPAQILWDCIQELAARSLDGVVVAAPHVRTTPTASAVVHASAPRSSASPSRPMPLSTPPPPPAAEPRPEPRPPVALGPNIPPPGATDTEPEGVRVRAAPGQRFRPSSTSMGRPAPTTGTHAAQQRRPQAQATPPEPTPPPAPAGRVRRGQTESDFDLETFVSAKDDWKATLAVEDEQLVDWSASDETVAGDDRDRKR